MAEELGQLKTSLEESQDQNAQLVQQLEQQRLKYDDISRQAYKKIKGLLDERQMYELEVETLRAQMQALQREKLATAAGASSHGSSSSGR